MSFIWLSQSSVHMGALSPTGHEPSWPLSAAFCVFLCSLCHSGSSGVLSESSVLVAPICILGRDPFMSLRWSALRIYFCIVSLICGACWASAPCSAPICVCCVESHLHSGTSTHSLVRGSPNSTPTHFFFPFSVTIHHHLLCLLMSFFRYWPLAALSSVILSWHPFHANPTHHCFLLSGFGGTLNCNQPVPECQDFRLHFSSIDLVWSLWTEIK